MVTYCKDCYPHCDFCIYSNYYYLEQNKEQIKVVIEGCKLHPDEHHQSLAQGLHYCKDFHCYKIEINNREEL